MKLEEIESFQATTRWTITAGDVVRFAGGGPEFVGDDGERHRLTLPGRWRVKRILRSGRTRHRHFLEVSGIDRTGGTYVVLVHGKPYRSVAGLFIKPYRLKRAKRETLAR